ncbi:MAG TPA: CPBP family intramembrane glutamic endopeptidase [Flavobacterium sp.]|jgi:hypothetical protein
MFIELAFKGDNTWWKVWLTAILSTAVFLVNFVFFLVLPEDRLENVYDSLKHVPNNLMLVIGLLPFIFLLALLLFLVHFLHERSIVSLTTSRAKIDFKRIGFSAGLIVFFSVVAFIISYFVDNSGIIWNFKPMQFTILFILSILLFPMQIAFEEYLFRGFLMQQIGIVIGNRWFPLLVTSVLFGLFHSANPEVAELGFGIMAFYIGTGLFLGIMTLMDEGLELALGFHFGNNLVASLLITSDFSALQTDALFRYSGINDPSALLNEMLITMAVTYPIFLLILAKKYKWSGWKEKLTGKIKFYGNAVSEKADGEPYIQ